MPREKAPPERRLPTAERLDQASPCQADAARALAVPVHSRRPLEVEPVAGTDEPPVHGRQVDALAVGQAAGGDRGTVTLNRLAGGTRVMGNAAFLEAMIRPKIDAKAVRETARNAGKILSDIMQDRQS